MFDDLLICNFGLIYSAYIHFVPHLSWEDCGIVDSGSDTEDCISLVQILFWIIK